LTLAPGGRSLVRDCQQGSRKWLPQKLRGYGKAGQLGAPLRIKSRAFTPSLIGPGYHRDDLVIIVRLLRLIRLLYFYKVHVVNDPPVRADGCFAEQRIVEHAGRTHAGDNTCDVLILRGGNEAAWVHHRSRWGRYMVAAHLAAGVETSGIGGSRNWPAPLVG
jgi:hypothetical protein